MQESGPIPIAKLEGQGINSADITKLEDAGYHTVESVYSPILFQIAFTTLKKLCTVKGISEAKAQKLITQAMTLVPMGFQTV